MPAGNDWIAMVGALLVNCRRSQQGFRQAADRVSDEDLREVLREQSERRGGFLRELRKNTEPYDIAGSAQSSAENIEWHGMSRTLDSDEAILGAVESADAELRRQYRSILDQELPEAVAETLRDQLMKIREADDFLDLLHERRRAA